MWQPWPLRTPCSAQVDRSIDLFGIFVVLGCPERYAVGCAYILRTSSIADSILTFIVGGSSKQPRAATGSGCRFGGVGSGLGQAAQVRGM